MINPAQQLLLDLVRNQGLGIIKNPPQLEIELKKSAQGQYNREITLWVEAAKHGIVALLIKNMDKPISMTAHHLVLKMHEDCGTDLQAANWTIESWMIALGMLSPDETLPLQGTTLQVTPQSNNKVSSQSSRKPEWAITMARDDMGIYADTNIMDVIQRFRWIAPGTFMMGSPETEINHFQDETQFEATLTRGFWMADTTCTQALWEAVMATNPSAFRDNENNPVERISWDEVQEFLAAVRTLMPGMNVKLPTGAQWEYACRAGTTTPFSFGENITTDQVNYDGTKPYADAPKSIFRRKTVAVKSLPPNPWGLYEIHGNVWEWCQDLYGEYPTEPTVDPVGPKLGTTRTLRGGSWSRGARGVRSANRSGEVRSASNDQTGFRFIIV